MLASLDIKNYRNLKELKIKSLSRVNLIAGKNNSGKSCLLEAIAIYVTEGNVPLIYQLLEERGENYSRTEENKNKTDANIRTLSSLFTNRIVSFKKEDIISIRSIESALGEEKPSGKSIALRFVKYFEEIQKESQGRTRIALETESDNHPTPHRVGFEISVGNNSFILSLDENIPDSFWFGNLSEDESLQFVGTRSIDREANGKLFDNIILTEKEQYVIDALKIIEPSAERIAFVGKGPGERTAVMKLSNNQGTLPLRSMGDGINRIFTIILALVNADNGFLLIDEFEIGLHHTVQKQLWNIILKLAHQLNVQVFATTHSWDCLCGFENALNSSGNSFDGKLIRLDNKNGIIKEVEFDAYELEIANDRSIEIR